MRKVLLFGAGKSATILIDYLLRNAERERWELTVVDANPEPARQKIGSSPFGKAIAFDINNATERNRLISNADIVISLLPPSLHSLVAKSCIANSKNLLTASYVDDDMRNMKKDIEEKGLLFLCEMGLDPGIDHMSAKKIIDKIHEENGRVVSFRSHCGGLVAPESDNNPWHYKISWNPRNILMAGKDGARYKENGKVIKIAYEDLFHPDRLVGIPDPDIGFLSWYPNRDSLGYIDTYSLHEAETFIRTTLRHPDFMIGWKNIVDLKLTDEKPLYQTDGKSLMHFFKEHMEKNGFSEWLQQKLTRRLGQAKDMIENLMKIIKAENEAKQMGEEIPESFMAANKKGDIETIHLDDIKSRAAEHLAYKMHEANLILKQLLFLGMDDETTLINKGLCSAADVMQLVLEKKLALQPQDKDMIIMLHEIEYETQREKSKIKSSLIVKGDDAIHTAMAKTVGLPLGIAARLVLNGKIGLKGLHIPVQKEIYNPVLEELEDFEIKFLEKTELINDL